MSIASPDEVNAQAAAWLARRDAGGWTSADDEELGRWMDNSLRHRIAYLRLEHVWRESGRLKALGAGAPPGTIPEVGQWRRSPFSNTGIAKAATAEQLSPTSPELSHAPRGVVWARWVAALVLLGAVILSLWFLGLRGDSYRTPVGALEIVAMEDGSKVTLNTNSQIRVALTPKERAVELRRGEAFFEVAKDSTRPFVVHAGRSTVTAVGTEFSVRRDDQKTRVIVTEGVVRVATPDVTSTDVMPSMASQTVKAGEIARISDAGVLVQGGGAALEEQLSWRVGVLVFKDARLAEAIAEFNRYNTKKIVLADPSLADLRVAGSFKSGSTAAFVHLLEQGFPIRVEDRDDRFVLAPR